jgi:UDP-N-acetylmuramoyl-tripeptide--D-alanyl-D-alanine ligase
MKITDLYALFEKYPKVSTDTRNIQDNSIFFALKGANFNGNKFAKQALENGARFAVIDEAQNLKDERFILVDDVLKTLQNLANHHRNQFDIPVLGITGTNGKTTTKELLNEVLSQKYNVLATAGNFNNHIGVPLTLLKLKPEHDLAIIEMGANHPGEIYELCQISEPNYGFVTNVGMAHLEGFGSFQNIIETKSGLYRFVEENKGVNFMLEENHELINVSSNKAFEFFSINNKTSKFYGTVIPSELLVHFNLKRCDNEDIDNFIIKTKLVGSYNQSNILASIAIGSYFNVSLEQIKKALESYTPSNNRSQITETNRNKLVLDAYNANPTSVLGALENFKSLQGINRVVILGDMFELGEFTQERHQEIVDYLVEAKFEKVFLLGKAYSNTESDLISIIKYQTLDDFIRTDELPNIKGATVLLKGSRGMGLEQLVKYL